MLKVDLKLYIKTVMPSLFVDEELNGKVGGIMLVLYLKGLLLYIISFCVLLIVDFKKKSICVSAV